MANHRALQRPSTLRLAIDRQTGRLISTDYYNEMQIVNINTRAEHIPEVAEWLFKEWGYLSPGVSLEQQIKLLTQRGRDNELPVTFIALEDNLPVGTVSLVHRDMKIRMNLTPWMSSVFVKPEVRGRGIGSQLVGFAEVEAQRRDIWTLYLFTPDKQRMYTRLGWKPLEEVQYRGEDVTIMCKTFSPELNSTT